MRILVTGGAGFIGSQIVDEYVRLGHRVSVIDNLSTGKKSNLNPKAKFYRIDIRDHKVAAVFSKEKPEIVNHHAAQKDVRFSVANPGEDAAINIIGSLNLLQNCVKHKVKRFIFASTGGSIYGDAEQVPTPDDYPAKPVSPYGCAKLAIENYLHYYHKVFGLPYIALRYANVYGPRQDASGEAGVVAIFIGKLLSGERPVIHGDGHQTRDFVFVKDVVQANVLALNEKNCGSYNIGSGIEVSINQLFEMIHGLVGSKLKAIHGPAKKVEQRRSALECTKAKLIMGWEPVYNLAEGLDKTVVLIPEESLNEYKNNSQIRKAFFKSISKRPPK